jgi:hydrogenase nickel incorporation protein HypB
VIPPPRLIEVRQHILKKNDAVARELRAQFQNQGTFVVSLVASPGAGKTELLRAILTSLASRYRVAALVGDLATENDARRLAESGAPVRQIVTGTVCHLEADMVRHSLEAWSIAAPELLFIENVGNLVCPASFDLGEHLRMILVSTTEGEDKPLKYPSIFHTSDITAITKMDLAEAVGFRRESLLSAIRAVRPGIRVFETSARTGYGVSELTEYLVARGSEARAPGI